MPKRTNDFQELIAIIQRALAPKAAKTTESAMEPVPGLKKPREIDILIESNVGPYRIKVAVEATKRSRKLDNEGFGKILSKFEMAGSTNVNKVVIVTPSGFTEDVISRAKLLDVDLLTINEAKEADWSMLSPKMAFTVAPHVCSVTFDPTHPSEKEKGFAKVARILCDHGNDLGTVADHAAKLFWMGVVPQRPSIVLDMQEYAKKSEANECYFRFKQHLSHHFVRYQGTDHKVQAINVAVHSVHATGTLECVEYEMKTPTGEVRKVQHAVSVVGPKKLTFAFPNALKSDRVVVKIDSASAATAPKASSKPQTNRRGGRGKKRTPK
jgi:hypothetical protein